MKNFLINETNSDHNDNDNARICAIEKQEKMRKVNAIWNLITLFSSFEVFHFILLDIYFYIFFFFEFCFFFLINHASPFSHLQVSKAEVSENEEHEKIPHQIEIKSDEENLMMEMRENGKKSVSKSDIIDAQFHQLTLRSTTTHNRLFLFLLLSHKFFFLVWPEKQKKKKQDTERTVFSLIRSPSFVLNCFSVFSFAQHVAVFDAM